MLDPLLAPFVAAPEGTPAEEALAAVLERHAWPLARAIATRKLSGRGPSSAAGPDDVDDVVGEAMLVMIGRLAQLREPGGDAPIESLLDYTAAVTHNVLAHLFRLRRPARARLKSRLRYLLSHRERLAVWEAGDGAICGLASSRGAAADDAAMAALRGLGETEVGASARSADSPDVLGRVAEEVLRRVEGPVDFDAFVGAMARLLRVEEPRPVAEGAEAVSTPDGEGAIDRQRALEAAWREIADLPERQRAALLLGLRETRGGSLLWLLPLLGVASLRAIARALGWPDAELAAVWPRLPLDDNAIAQRLGCTRQQVINLRMAARKRLSNREAARLGAGAGGANLAAVSASLGDEP